MKTQLNRKPAQTSHQTVNTQTERSNGYRCTLSKSAMVVAFCFNTVGALAQSPSPSPLAPLCAGNMSACDAWARCKSDASGKCAWGIGLTLMLVTMVLLSGVLLTIIGKANRARDEVRQNKGFSDAYSTNSGNTLTQVNPLHSASSSNSGSVDDLAATAAPLLPVGNPTRPALYTTITLNSDTEFKEINEGYINLDDLAKKA